MENITLYLKKKWVQTVLCLFIILISFFITGVSQRINTYEKAAAYHKNGDIDNAIIAYASVGNYRDAEANKVELIKIRSISKLAAGARHTIALRSDGTVLAAGDNTSGQCQISEWDNIVSVHAGNDFSIGLRNDGTVAVTDNDDPALEEISKWRDIIAVSANGDAAAAIKSDGTVVTTFDYDVSEWKNILDIAVSSTGIAGLKKNGMVVKSDAFPPATDKLRYLTKIEGSSTSLMVQKSNGIIQSTNTAYSLFTWYSMKGAAIGDTFMIGINENNTTYASGSTVYGEGVVGGWEDIQEVAAGTVFTVALRGDGTLMAAGDNSFGQCDVLEWNLYV